MPPPPPPIRPAGARIGPRQAAAEAVIARHAAAAPS
jgi:hypothetical protein